MSDIDRAGVSDLVLRDNYLKRQWIAIQVSEKEIQLKQLDVALDRLQSVDIKKIIHAKDKCKRELEELKRALENTVVDVKEVKNKK